MPWSPCPSILPRVTPNSLSTKLCLSPFLSSDLICAAPYIIGCVVFYWNMDKLARVILLEKASYLRSY